MNKNKDIMKTKQKRRLTNGSAKRILEEFGLRSSTRVWRVLDSGGLGLGVGTEAANLYEYIWQHRHEVLAPEYFDEFVKNDKIHQS